MAIFLEFLLTGISLSMDAFAIAICKGLGMTKVNKKRAVVIALFFGGFQALMPLIGWFLGSRFEKYIERFGHWIAFGLLLFIGTKMIVEAVKENEEEDEGGEKDAPLDIKELLLLSVATSIDALAVGVTYGILPDHPIFYAVTVIGLSTFVICIGGVFVGNIFGHKYEKKAQIAGGAILVLIGVKALLEGLGLISLSI
ncbi:MAG: manganese efflux pump MntP family protein [Lachnospiraceae bacterium]|nr:manganese efflux pump MntP family protein [Lachnospiraceae bacterium]